MQLGLSWSMLLYQFIINVSINFSVKRMKMGGVVFCVPQFNVMLVNMRPNQGVITPYPPQLIYTFFAY